MLGEVQPCHRALNQALEDYANADPQTASPWTRHLGWSQSRVSRIERGKTLPKPVDVRKWAHATQADPDTRRHLMEIADRASVQLTEWKRELAPGRRRKQEERAHLETDASVIRLFGGGVVPGLAQTRTYAAAMLRLGRPGVTDEPDDRAAALDARMARQSIIADTSKPVELLMSETALRRHLIPGPAQREQIDRLIALSQSSNVQLGVIPFAADERVHQYHAFAIFGDPKVDASAVVLVETLTRGLTIRAADEIAQYIDHFGQLTATALYGDELHAFLQEVSGSVTWS